jgi:DNA-3-methyladenine glycosylase
VSTGEAIPPDFYDRPCREVARDLLGTRLVSEVGGDLCVAEIVETEAYTGPEDEASHAAARIGRTARNEPMFGPAGTAYLYRIYGMHWCLNAVTGAEGHPAAVLIRAARLLAGEEAVMRRRGPRPLAELLRGPGNLARGLGLDERQNGHRLWLPPLRLLFGSPVADVQVRVGPRVGIRRAADLPLRFCVAGDPAVSRGPRPLA